jgi:hypothetical protein
MDSVPPATTISALPVMMVWAPKMTAFKLEAQTLLTVVQTVESWRPASRAHCLAGFCPRLPPSHHQHWRFSSVGAGDVRITLTSQTEHFRRRPLRHQKGRSPPPFQWQLQCNSQHLNTCCRLTTNGWFLPLIAWEPNWVADRLERELIGTGQFSNG